MTASWQAMLAGPTMLADSLRLNAQHFGRRIDDWRDEEPGKPLHEARRGPLSELNLDPFAHYHGDWSTAPDFLIFLGQYYAWTADLDTVRELLPTAGRALSWIDRYGDLDHDGFLEYHRRSRGGLKNQGWKDSDTAVVDEQGRVVPNPIATSEVQAYWYSALRHAAGIYAVTGHPAVAARLAARAVALRRRFHRAFWLPEQGCYAMALGPDRQPVRSVNSNDGHLLATGIVPPRIAPWSPTGCWRRTCSAAGESGPCRPGIRRTTRSAITGAVSGRSRPAPSASGWLGTAAGSTCTGWPRGCSRPPPSSPSTVCRRCSAGCPATRPIPTPGSIRAPAPRRPGRPARSSR